MLAVLSFSQSRYWLDNTDFLHRAIDVNPGASFAYNNLTSRTAITRRRSPTTNNACNTILTT